MKLPSFDPAVSVPGTDRHVLVLESDPDQRRRVVSQLQAWGYTPLAAGSAEDALEMIDGARVAFSLVALRLPGLSGIEFLRRAPELAESGPVILVRDGGQSGSIVEATQAGANEFLRRPYTADDLENAVKGLSGKMRVASAPPPPSLDENGERLRQEQSLLVSPAMREILSVVEQAARADVTVLVCGETGVGKDLVARSIHHYSPRRRAPY